MSNKNKLFNIKTLAFIIVILLFVGVFYWVQIRPSQIRSSCYDKTWEALDLRKAQGKRNKEGTFDKYYDMCLKSEGLK